MGVVARASERVRLDEPVSANADGLRRQINTWAGNLVPVALDDLADRMRPEAPIAPAGSEDAGGSRSRGELRRSIRSGPVQLGFDRMTGRLEAPVIQAATTDQGAAPHWITATQPHGKLVFFSRNAGRVVIIGSARNPGRVWHPGNAAQNWWTPGLLRHWPESLAVAMRSVPF